MAGETPDTDKRGGHPADDAALSARLARLGAGLGQIKARRPETQRADSSPTSDMSGMARGFRLSTELVAGVLAGAGLGWLLDYWLGSSPWGMIVFLLLGFAAGVLNVMRAAGVVAPNALDDPGQGDNRL